MADILSADPNDPVGGYEPYSPGTGTPDFGTGSDGSFWSSLMNSLSGISPTALAGILGGLGPTAGLIGSLASGGQGPTTTGQSNSSNQQSQSGSTSGTSSTSQTGYSNTVGSQQGSQTGFGNTTTTPKLDAAGQAAEDRLNALLGGNAGAAQGAYTQGLSMLQALAAGQGGPGGAGAGIERPNTSPQPQAVTGFPTELPTAYNPAIGNLIKQAFGSFVGDLGGQAITNARARGFAGGADLLNTAAAPMMGQSLAQVPAMEAKAYMDHVLQAYGLQSENAGRENAARAGALNAATNALGPGIQAYGIDKQSANQELANMTSLLQALMGPQQQMMAGNTALLNAAPRTTSQNSLTGGTSNMTTLSGNTSGSQSNAQSQSQSQGQSNSLSQGNTSGTSTTPMGTVIGQGAANIGQGVATGVAAQQARDASSEFQKSLLAALAGRS